MEIGVDGGGKHSGVMPCRTMLCADLHPCLKYDYVRKGGGEDGERLKGMGSDEKRCCQVILERKQFALEEESLRTGTFDSIVS